MITLSRRAFGGALAGAAIGVSWTGMASSASPQTHCVDVRAFGFEPAMLTIRPGDSVEWVNHDLAPHTATEVDWAWDTGEMTKGDSRTVAFNQPGSVEYFCVFHPHMKGRITVEE